MKTSNFILMAFISIVVVLGAVGVSSPTDSQAKVENGLIPVNFFQVKPIPPCGRGTEGLRFILFANGTEVCDNFTGLYWVQRPSSPQFFWQDAIDYCANLNLNKKRWRLPQFEELITLVAFTEVDQSQASLLNAPNGPFANVQTVRFYWTATADANNPSNQAWDVDFSSGGVFSAAVKDEELDWAWCVR